MTRINKLTLIKEIDDKDAIGQPISSEVKKELIAEIQSVTQSEFMQGQQDGLSPAYVFKISTFVYSGERIVEFNGERYSVYRTFQPDVNQIELYTELEVGSHTEPEVDTDPEPELDEAEENSEAVDG